VEVLHLAADSGELPSQGGEKPHLLVTASLDALREQLQAALLDGIGVLDAASARRIACDCKVIPAVLGSDSEPLDIGRISYTAPIAIRRALILRDGGCAFPGCDRPHRWCHAHHVRHWADGGPTELGNLVLLCGRHHRLIHHSDWRCAIVNGRPEFYPPHYIDTQQRPRRNTLHHSTSATEVAAAEPLRPRARRAVAGHAHRRAHRLGAGAGRLPRQHLLRAPGTGRRDRDRAGAPGRRTAARLRREAYALLGHHDRSARGCLWGVDLGLGSNDVDDLVKDGDIRPVVAEPGESDRVGPALHVGGLPGHLLCKLAGLVGLVGRE
jgi:Domain of unknown function (DUF222)/HNH endonuclease